MLEKQKKRVVYFLYSLIIVFILGIFAWLGNFNSFQEFIIKIEESSFDLRQIVASKYKVNNDDIVILALDDSTYEYVMDKYGQWPISRGVWGDIVKYLEIANPKCIIFDLLFIKPNANDLNGDEYFIKSIKNNNNIYFSMNFDNYSDDIRKSPIIADSLKLNINSGELFDNNFIQFNNARLPMKSLLNVNDNIGAINVTRDNDGIIRNIAPIYKYKGDYYPNLSLKAYLDLNKIENVSIKDNQILLDKNHKIILDDSNRAIINWYGKSHTYKHVSAWELIRAIKQNNSEFIKKNFENKIVYIGTTATSLSDVKSAPVESNMSGVELHANFINNIIDSNFIKKVSIKTDFIIALFLSFLMGYCVLKMSSVLKTLLALFIIVSLYSIFATFIMVKFNLWVSLVIPIFSIFASFMLIYCEKYILKVKDYEQTYKLAVTDGLTQLYNHRYFQEQMIVNCDNYSRYQTVFSMILIDIDFFKKFNDKYGHQSGDCVLRQVADILKKNSRSTDVACRYGGEEMAIILTNTAKKEAIITAQKICAAVSNNKFILANGSKTNVTISVGVATVNENCIKPQDIIEYCDKCLYKAKEFGRNQVVFDI